MPLSTDIKLPRDYVAKLPESCVACREETSGNVMKYSTRNVAWTDFFWWFPSKKATVQLPACHECAFRIRIRRMTAWFAMGILILLCWLFVWPLMVDVPRPVRKWALILTGLVCLTPVFAWDIFWPRAFDMIASKKTITYEFKNVDSAQEFIELNLDAEFLESS